jgi:hypothetical protein
MIRGWLFLISSLFAVQSLFCSANHFILEVPEEKQKIIIELISIMGNSSTLSLGFKKTHLEGLGKELKGVDTLQFLAYIFSEPSLHKHMRSIKGSSFKWVGFMRGIGPRLKQEQANQNFLEVLPAFAAFLSAPHERLEKAAKEQNWDEFILTLIESRK